MRLPGRFARQRGFTLLEVLVALAVLALALAAIIQAGGGYAANQVYLRDRVMAHWVARNLLMEYQIKEEWPRVGDRTGDEEMAGRRWEWRIDVSETDDEDLRRLDIEIRPEGSDDDEKPLLVLSGFLKNPG
jgi:general secretion pathway protein I